MVLLAFSLSDQIEKYGSYVGIASFFGLALLSLLYFAQAREVKRLREWAGRAPERAAELEQAVLEHAEEVRRTPVPQPQPVAEPAVANGAVTLKPAEIAALAFARAAGVHNPHEPKRHAVPAAPVAVAEPTAVAAAVATEEPAAAPALAPTTNGGGNGSPPPPPPVTPAARRAEPAPLPPRRSAHPSRRPSPPPRRESNTRAVVLTIVIGVLVLGGAAFAVTRLTGGGDQQAKAPNIVPTPTEEAGSSATPEPPNKAKTPVMVFNGTGVPQLAARTTDRLAQDGYARGNLGTDSAPEAQWRATSVVMYKRGAKAAAQQVANTLDVQDVQPLDDTTQALIANSETPWSVVVIVGTDKS